MTGLTSHNISKDILKWRLDARQQMRRDTSASAVAEHRHVLDSARASLAEVLAGEEEVEPLDANLSQPLSADTFVPFMQQHELTLVNFYAPWCIWCQRCTTFRMQLPVPSPHCS